MRKISRTVRRIQVLIETYWNVNEYPQDVVNAGRLSINRNILECKYESIKLIHNRFFSINRNILECKYESIKLIHNRFFSINRNILECKFYIIVYFCNFFFWY
ncbi:hypothetical protein BLAHAN_04044 [Blautia hansenii DSM 20583]|uniref:Uncharacterized protein n=1 Tax=Blautia hansenii DSM 20583 TaxID=537007 RepID=C9L3V7_BLAHA|nr:hypothetical protein BLAHAN_04044 [Blautia hansenii DSM 20583]